MLSSGKSASTVSIATTNRRHEPVCHKTALKGPAISAAAFLQNTLVLWPRPQRPQWQLAPCRCCTRRGGGAENTCTNWVPCGPHAKPGTVNRLGDSVLVSRKLEEKFHKQFNINQPTYVQVNFQVQSTELKCYLLRQTSSSYRQNVSRNQIQQTSSLKMTVAKAQTLSLGTCWEWGLASNWQETINSFIYLI